MPRRNNGPRLRFLEKRGSFYIVWTDRGRSRERSTGTAERGEAQIALAEFLRQQPSNVGPRDPSEVLLTSVLADYVLDHGEEVMDKERLAGAVLKLTDYFQGRRVQGVTKQTCRGYGRWRDRAPGTVRRGLTVLRAAINHAHREGKLTRPVSVDLPDAPPPRPRWLTRDEAARLLRAAMQEPRVRHHLPLFIKIGLYTGQRKEAILSLRWPMVDLRNHRVDFRIAGRRVTKKKRSHVQIPPRLISTLQNARRGTDLGHVVNENGIGIGDVQTSFNSAVRRAGLAGTGVTPHTLRHTCATWLMQAGVPKWEAAGFLAMSMDTLERTYGHHHPDHFSTAANSFSRRPRNVRASPDENGVSGSNRAQNH